MTRHSFFHIDNPGGGHCAFYALAIGLIAQIQSRADGEAFGRRILTELQCESDQVEVWLTRIRAYSLSARGRSDPLLTWMQAALRQLLVNKAVENLSFLVPQADHDLDAWETQIKNNPLYQIFAEQVEASLRPNRINQLVAQSYNPLSESDRADALARKVAEKTKAMLAVRGIVSLPPKEQEVLRDRYLIASFVKDVFASDGINPDSILISEYQRIANSNRWGTDQDLIDLAGYLNIQILIWRDQEPTSPLSPITEPDQVIHLENQSQTHWVTLLPKPEQGILKAQLQAYLPSLWFAWRYYTRHHVRFVTELIAAIDQNESEAEIQNRITNYTASNRLNPNGALKKILDCYSPSLIPSQSPGNVAFFKRL